MERYRLTASMVALFVYLLVLYPWPTIVVSILLVIMYLIFRGGSKSFVEQNSRSRLRQAALRSASIYLAPYNDIWNNLKLSNKYCSMRLRSYGFSITARDTTNPKRSFRIVNSKVHSYDNLWNMFCLNFNHNTTFDELIQLADRFEAVIELTDIQKTVINNNQNDMPPLKVDFNDEQKIKSEKKEKLDINNASEVELTALPGVSIVMAKKLIKKREEIGGFKSVNDVCLFLRLKPHMQTQLENLICVKKMKGSLRIERYKERKLDL